MVKEKGDDLKSGDNVRLRSDGRYEARYQKGRDENGKIIEFDTTLANKSSKQYKEDAENRKKNNN